MQSPLSAIIKSSLINCHAIGLDSIVLKPAPNMVRIFIARGYEHTLWRNNPDTNEPYSVGVHPHHCDITMVPLLGSIANIVLSSGSPTHKLHQFKYRSTITGRAGDGSVFKYTGKDVRVSLHHQPLRYPTQLLASALHTVYVPKGKWAAWMICEGREWPNYEPLTLSNHRLDTTYSATGLYKPMTLKRLREYGGLLGVQIPSPAQAF